MKAKALRALGVCAWIVAAVLGTGIAAEALAQAPATAPDASPVQSGPTEPAPATPPPQVQPKSLVPARPDEPRAAKVYAVFEAYCARCHQTGRSERMEPAGGVANILALDEVARDATLVIPGVPDASPLYDKLLSRHAPLEVFGGGGDGKEPAPEDLEAVRAWIRDVPRPRAQCAGRQPIKLPAIEGWIDEAQRVAREGAADLRFVSLAELYNACASPDEIAAARQAVSKILNSLSWAPTPHKPTPLDPDGTLLSLRLSDYGFVSAHWESLLRLYPKALITPVRDKLRSASGSTTPLIRGDWLADAVSDPKTYYQLLGLPPKLADLAKLNGVDINYNVRIARARRAVVRTSAVTRGNRMAERHPGSRGGFWLMHDFATSAGEQDLFEHPLGPKSASGVKAPFKADLVRVQFVLPNGFFAYALYDAAGNRIDSVLPGIAKSDTDGAPQNSRAGAGCFACHSDGVKSLRDDYRAQFAGDTSAANKDIREAALQLSATDGELVLLKDADNERYRNALAAAGIDTGATYRGHEIVAGLARRYRSGATYAGVAAELGLEPEAFDAALQRTTGANALLAHRLHNEQLDRKTLEPLIAYLKGVEPQPPPAADASVAAPGTGRIGLNLWLDKLRPAPGDVVTVNVQSDTDCYLTLLNVDVSGKATVVLPNDFEPDNLLAAGKPFRVPKQDAPYQLRRKEQGRELLIAQCSTSPAPPTGVEHEFERQRFTVLGNWENFVRDTLITDADLRRSPEKAERARRAAAQSRRGQRGGDVAADRADTAPGRQLVDGRAVLIVE